MTGSDASRIGPLARTDGEPAFEEPWQAEVLALAFALTEAGAFSRAEWSDTLGAKLRAASTRSEPDNQATYYAAALAALERLLADRSHVGADALSARTEQWRRAYLNTPHGQPVELSAGGPDRPHP